MEVLLTDTEIKSLAAIAYKNITVGDKNYDKLSKEDFKNYILDLVKQETAKALKERDDDQL